MFMKPFFEFIAIGLTALCILLMAFVATPVAIVSGSILILLSGVALYWHYVRLGTSNGDFG